MSAEAWGLVFKHVLTSPVMSRSRRPQAFLGVCVHPWYMDLVKWCCILISVPRALSELPQCPMHKICILFKCDLSWKQSRHLVTCLWVAQMHILNFMPQQASNNCGSALPRHGLCCRWQSFVFRAHVPFCQWQNHFYGMEPMASLHS